MVVLQRGIPTCEVAHHGVRSWFFKILRGRHRDAVGLPRQLHFTVTLKIWKWDITYTEWQTAEGQGWAAWVHRSPQTLHAPLLGASDGEGQSLLLKGIKGGRTLPHRTTLGDQLPLWGPRALSRPTASQGKRKKNASTPRRGARNLSCQ